MIGFLRWIWSFRKAPEWEVVSDGLFGMLKIRWSRPNARGKYVFAGGCYPTGLEYVAHCRAMRLSKPGMRL
jgi:hypothetical protein